MTNSRALAVIVWLLASIFYAYQYIIRVMPNIMMTDIMDQFDIDAGIFGQFSGVYYIGYSLMHLPLGIMLDRFGPRRIMTICILLTVIGMAPMIYCDHWIMSIIGRLLIGIGSSAAIVGTFKIIRLTFEEKLFSRMLSFSVTIGLLGAIYGGGPIKVIYDAVGYEAIIELSMLFGLLLAFLTCFLVPEISELPMKHMTISSEIKIILTNHKVISLAIFAGLMVGPLEGFADVWGSAFLKQVYEFDSNISSSMPSIIFIGMCFGAPVLNFIAEKTANYMGVIITSGIIMMLSFIALIFGDLDQTIISILFVLIGICSAYQILALYKASTYAPNNMGGLTTAIVNMIIMIFGYAFHSTIGMVVNNYGGQFSRDAFVYGISVIPIALGIGAAGLFVLNVYDRSSSH
jgi:MFS family permease